MPERSNPPDRPAASTGRAAPPQRRLSGWRWILTTLLLLAVNYALATFCLPSSTPQRVNIPYTLFSEQVQASNVATISAQGDQIQGRFKQPVSFTPDGSSQASKVTAFATVQPTFSDPALLSVLQQ